MIMRGWRELALATAITLVGEAASASGNWVTAADDAGEPRVEARIVVHPTARSGARVRAGVQFRIDPGWHIYWKNPGDSGIATQISWRDAAAGSLAWPAPRAFSEADGELVTFGYAGDVLLATRLEPSGSHQGIRADVELLACRTSCIPASFTLSAPLAPRADERAELLALFGAHDAALPAAAKTFGATARAERVAGEVRVRVSPCDGDGACAKLAVPEGGAAFFPEPGPGAGLRTASAESDAGVVSLSLRGDEGVSVAQVRGVFVLLGADGALHSVEIDAQIAGSGNGVAVGSAAGGAMQAAAESPPALAASGLIAMLGLALLGGLILNLMPCVLPVLAMKVFAIGELAGQSRREALQHGVAYGAGIELSMLALAAAALALRGAGYAVGWGFQFQEPAYVAAISAVLVGFALNLFGVFEIGFQPSALAEVGTGALGARRSFFEGLLAVALATPCSAPFLGTAIGFAFASSAAIIVSVFLAIGAGLALPFVAISAFPRLGRFMPRSGAWMGTLRSGLGFALLATVVWLLWIVGRGAGSDYVAALLTVLLAGAFIAWSYGRLQLAGARFAGVGAGLAVLVLVAGGANLVGVAAAAHGEHESESAPSPHGAAWSASAVTSALAAGRPAFVVFSADWCLTCKLNERIAVETAETRALLEAGDFALFHGDWTQRDEAIRLELARHGKAGVPLYLVYSPTAPNVPLVLPEVVTQKVVSRALRTAVR